MRIHFQRTGGFAGLRLATTIDVDDLPKDDAKRIYSLIDDIDFFDLPEELHSKDGMPDQYQYEITIETSKGKHSVSMGEPRGEKMEEFIGLLSKLMRRKPKGR